MLKLVVAVLVPLLVASGPVVWYGVQARQAEARAEEFADWAQSQRPVLVEFVVTAPRTTSPDQPLYLSGSAANLGSWSPTGVRLEKRGDGRYHATVELMSGIRHAFRVTRGANAPQVTPHRSFVVAGPAVIEATVTDTVTFQEVVASQK